MADRETSAVQRITITIDDELLETLDDLTRQRGYASRSEALRDITRDAIRREQGRAQGRESCIATLSYVYDHESRDLSQRLAHAQHDHHHLTIATMHVHLDHDSCLEVAVLRGAAGEVQALSDGVTTQRGVRHGHLHLVPARVDELTHGHGEARHAHIKV